MTDDAKWNDIRIIWKANQWLYLLVGLLAGALLGPFLTQLSGSLFELLNNLVPEAVGITVTVLILDRLNEIRAERRAVKALQDQLVREAGGRANDRAIAAIDHMRDMGWEHLLKRVNFVNAHLNGADLSGLDLSGLDFTRADLEKVNLKHTNLSDATMREAKLEGSDLKLVRLRGAFLVDAKLIGANLLEGKLASVNLRRAKLMGASLRQADLEDAILSWANLQGADIGNANLTGTELIGANLAGVNLGSSVLLGADLGLAQLANADLQVADLQSINLSKAKLTGASLRNANLSGATLTDTLFDTQTVLPDAKYQGKGENGKRIYDKYWTPDTDMSRYTDPDHPDFWQPDWVKEQEQR